MSTQTVQGSGSTNNNSGAFVGPGVIPSTSNLTQTSNARKDTLPTAPVENSSYVGTQKVFDAGTFCYQPTRGFIIRGGGAITNLGGVDTDIDPSPNRNTIPQSIHKMETRKTAIKTDWDMLTGRPDTVTISDDDFGTDDAASPTRAIPGEFTYVLNGTPQTSEYNAKSTA